MKSNLFPVKIIALTFFAIIFCSVTGLMAQKASQTISGKVTDEIGKGLPGVTVTVKGSKGSSSSAVTVIKKQTAQGAFDESAWARGQSWGLYGYTMMYRYTKDKQYLDQAQHIASFILNNPNLPSDKIPYWDYNAPGIPNAQRDASAGAIMASALIELSGYSDDSLSKKYLGTASTILHTLSSNQYKAAIGTNGGFLLMHSVANMNKNAEVDAPLPYADYYYAEAMYRYKKLLK